MKKDKKNENDGSKNTDKKKQKDEENHTSSKRHAFYQ